MRRSFRFSAEFILLLAIGPILTASDRAEDSAPIDTMAVDSAIVYDLVPAEVVIDTLLFKPDETVSRAGQVTNPVDLERHLTQLPTLALFKSMLVPGWGQLGNRKYTKALLFAGLETWFFLSALHYGRDANTARDNYQALTDPNDRWEWYQLYDNERKNRNKFLWFAGLTIFISMFDAYVDAHLSGSPVEPRNDDIAIEVVPEENGGVAAVLSYRF
jgi:hypothetical protein